MGSGKSQTKYLAFYMAIRRSVVRPGPDVMLLTLKGYASEPAVAIVAGPKVSTARNNE